MTTIASILERAPVVAAEWGRRVAPTASSAPRPTPPTTHVSLRSASR